MARSTEGVSGDTLSRAMVLFAVCDLFFSVALLGTWFVAGLVDLRVALVTSALRSLLWLLHLRSLLTPVRGFREQGERARDELVLEADAALQSLARRSGFSFAASCLCMELLWAAVALLDVPYDVPSGRAELLAALLFAASAPGLGTLVRLLLESALSDVRSEVSLAALSRSLNPQRPRVSSTRPLVSTAIWMLLGALLAAGGGVLVWSAQIQREHAVSTQRQRVEHSVTRVSSGAGAPLEGVTIVEADALPAQVAARLEAAARPGNSERAVVAFHDLEAGQAIAAAALDDGRFALSAVEPDEKLGVIFGVLILIVIMGTPMFGAAFWLFARLTSAPLERFADATQRFVEQGELQALERIVPLRNDELGRLATSFNSMLDILEQLTATAAAVSAGDLRVELDHPGALHDAFRGMLVRLNEIVLRMHETSLELAAAAAEINAMTQESEQAALTQSSTIQQVASSVTSLAASAQQIANAAKSARLDAEQAVVTTHTTSEKIAQLRHHTASIGELLQIIGEIAERSDLLALNGSLEATRAGEAGRGFALVAAEMRRLAERVTGTVNDVRVQVADVEASSASTIIATQENRELTQRTADAAREISNVTAAQSADTEQASQGVQSVADMVVKASLAMSQTRATAEGLHAHAAELERLIASFEVRSKARGPSSSG